MKKLSIELINGIVAAAEKVGGIHNLEMPSRAKSWRTCVRRYSIRGYYQSYLYFNNAVTHSTDTIRIK